MHGKVVKFLVRIMFIHWDYFIICKMNKNQDKCIKIVLLHIQMQCFSVGPEFHLYRRFKLSFIVVSFRMVYNFSEGPTWNDLFQNIAWGSTTRTKLKKLASKDKQAIRAIYAAEYTREKIEEIKFLNIYKLNIYKVLTFMFKVKRDSTPLHQVFRSDLRQISHQYPIRFIQSNFEPNKIYSFVSRFKALNSTFKSRTKKHGIL